MKNVISNEKKKLVCSACGTTISEDEAIKQNQIILCKNCWNEMIKRDRNRLSIAAFFIVFILFQLCFYIPTLVSENRGFPSLLLIVLCVVIGTLCGMIAYEEVYARMSRKITHL